MIARLSSTSALRFARLGAVLVIVLGIFGMHALSHHGITHAEPTPGIATLAASMTADVATGHAHHQPWATPHSTPATDTHATDSRDDAGGTGHGLGEMVMLCVAMLAATATVLSLLAFIRRVPRVWVVLRPTATYFYSAAWLNPTGSRPPPEWRFSVIRC